MQSDSLTLYKLIILFMLNKVDFPLTNSQLTEFILDKGYTTYFNFQQSIHELMESKMIRQETVRNSSHYHITPTGKETITYFEHKIPPAIIDDAIEFLQNHKYERKSHFGSQCLYGIDDFGAHPWGIVQRQDNWHQQNERMKLVARTDIEQDYLRLIDIHKEEEIRSYLKNKYRFLNDSHFVEQCIDEWIADNGTF